MFSFYKPFKISWQNDRHTDSSKSYTGCLYKESFFLKQPSISNNNQEFPHSGTNGLTNRRSELYNSFATKDTNAEILQANKAFYNVIMDKHSLFKEKNIEKTIIDKLYQNRPKKA